MNLSEHFTLEELIATQHRHIDNTPPPDIVDKLRVTARGMEHVRLVLGAPIIVLSGFRCRLLNEFVGGADDSQHMKGEAVDWIAPRFGTPYECAKALAASDVRFDQLIWEGTWVHVSFVEDRKPRLEVLTWRRGQGYLKGLVV